MIRVGIVGIGFMGWIHWLGYKRVDGIEVTAICTRDQRKREGDWSDIKGNFGPAGEQVDLERIEIFEELSKMLESPNVDVVDICLPPHLHVQAVTQSLQAGKHVFCEKPLALSSAECDVLVEAAQNADRQLAVGHVLPFFPEYVAARQLIGSGKYGAIIGGSFKRIISNPTWIGDFFDPERVGGPLIDLHVHDAHLIRILFGMPVRVIGKGRLKDDVVEFCHSIFEFSDPQIVVHSVCGVIEQQGRPFTHGFEIQLEHATLQFELAAFTDSVEIMPLKVLLPDGSIERPSLPEGDDIAGFAGEITELRQAIASGVPSPVLSAELARDAIVLCHAQATAVKTRQAVEL